MTFLNNNAWKLYDNLPWQSLSVSIISFNYLDKPVRSVRGLSRLLYRLVCQDLSMLRRDLDQSWNLNLLTVSTCFCIEPNLWTTESILDIIRCFPYEADCLWESGTRNWRSVTIIHVVAMVTGEHVYKDAELSRRSKGSALLGLRKRELWCAT